MSPSLWFNKLSIARQWFARDIFGKGNEKRRFLQLQNQTIVFIIALKEVEDNKPSLIDNSENMFYSYELLHEIKKQKIK